MSWLRRLFGRSAGPGLDISRQALARLERLDLRIRRPAADEHHLVQQLARLVVLAAEVGRSDGDCYCLVLRPDQDDETVLLPLGPHLQALGERAQLELARTALDRRTVLWLCFSSELAAAEVVDPLTFDPESEAALDSIDANHAVRWAAAATVAREPRLVLARALLWLGPTAATPIATAADRLWGKP